MRLLPLVFKFNFFIFLVLIFIPLGCGPDQAENWGLVGNADFTLGTAGYESLALGEDSLYLAYQDGIHDNRVTVQKFSGNHWTLVGSQGFSPVGTAANLSLCVDPDSGEPYVAYDISQTKFDHKQHSKIPQMIVSNKTFVEKYDGKKWILLGSGPVGKGVFPSLVVHRNIPYVFYHTDAGELEVLKFNGKSWQVLGGKPFSTNGIPYTWRGLFVDGNDHVYCGFRDQRTKQAYVEEYDGKNWITLGRGPASNGGTGNGSLAIDNGVVYLAYIDTENGDKATVIKYDAAGVWEPVGSKDFTGGTANFLSLAVLQGVPYLAYQDHSKLDKSTVMGYENGAWEMIGNAGFSVGAAFHESLVVDPAKNSFFVAFRDSGYGNKALVMGSHLLVRQ
jgi:hypothetical protein